MSRPTERQAMAEVSQTDLHFDSKPELDNDLLVDLTPDVECGEHES